MKHIKWLGVILLLVFALTACAAASADTVSDVKEQMAQDSAVNYAPQVRTLKNGVQVQRTPNGGDSIGINSYYANTFFDSMGFNNKYLKADRRGCGACHEDLATVATNLKGYPHLQFASNTEGLEIDMNVGQCMICHNYAGGTTDAFTFGNLMHMLHDGDNKAFSALGGDCWSCHYAAEDGESMQLWDDVKYDVLRGITYITADDVQGEFVWEQETTIDVDDLYDVQWYFHEDGVTRYGELMDGAVPQPETDGIYDQWTITVDGEVDNPFEMTLNELIEAIPPVTTTMTSHCGDNMIGGPWIGNVEITGIPVESILEYAAAKAGTKNICMTTISGDTYNAPIAYAEECGAYLVLSVSGEPLPYRLGYPVSFWIGGRPAWDCGKQIVRLTIENDEVTVWPAGLPTEDGISYYKPNVGLCHFAEGQIIEADEPYTFEGYASAWDDAITAVEFSFDRGETWITCETPDANMTNWVYWHYTWQAPSEGSYVIMIRSVCTDGSATYQPIEYLVNAQ